MAELRNQEASPKALLLSGGSEYTIETYYRTEDGQLAPAYGLRYSVDLGNTWITLYDETQYTGEADLILYDISEMEAEQENTGETTSLMFRVTGGNSVTYLGALPDEGLDTTPFLLNGKDADSCKLSAEPSWGKNEGVSFTCELDRLERKVNEDGSISENEVTWVIANDEAAPQVTQGETDLLLKTDTGTLPGTYRLILTWEVRNGKYSKIVQFLVKNG
jgi:hypothetical protein